VCHLLHISVPWKNKEVLLHLLGILHGAVHHAEKYKSVAPDAEIECDGKTKKNPNRSVKRVLQRFVNQSNLHIKLSDYQIAAMLLDIPSVITSEQFAYVNPQAQMAYRTFVQRENDGQRLQDELIDHLNNEEDRHFYQNMEEDGFIAPKSDIDSKEEEDKEEQETDEMNELPVYNLEDIQKGIGYLMLVTFKNGDKTKGKDPI
jgi:hypothetical protein